ncbi:Na(+)/H(+) antiporter NhaA [Nitrospira sp.]|nr:Na(+)/H(+) antiporter NhaA [Nitrospira sp.]
MESTKKDIERQITDTMRSTEGEALLNAPTDIMGGALLLGSTLLALLWVNSPWSESYHTLWHVQVSIQVGPYMLNKSLLHWVNDGLMAMFFFVAGLEIKRELLAGELASVRQATLPIVAACGGMLVPAVVYLSLNLSGPESSGWGIPMATDIAFALGIYALLDRGLPQALRIFLLTLAIVDDLGAVVVIALFYTSDLSIPSLLVGGFFFGALLLANALNVRSTVVYSLLGIGGLWVAFVLSGVHATVAGVLGALAIPARPHISGETFLQAGHRLLRSYDRAAEGAHEPLRHPTQADAANALERASDLAQTPVQRLERALNPWTLLGVMPLFALANAGVPIDVDSLRGLSDPIPLGIMIGLVIGKPLGIIGATWLAVRLKLGVLAESVEFRHLHAVGWLAGMGFTMSLFITTLAFHEVDSTDMAKLAVLLASLLSGTIGSLLLYRLQRTS